MNSLNLVGRLTRDVNVTTTDKGTEIGKFTVAVNRPFAKDDSEQKADFINCTAFGNVALNLSKFCKKGSLIAVQGRVQSFNFENDEGKKIFGMNVIANSIQFLDSKKNKSNDQEDIQEDKFFNSNPPLDIDFEDLPF